MRTYLLPLVLMAQTVCAEEVKMVTIEVSKLQAAYSALANPIGVCRQLESVTAILKDLETAKEVKNEEVPDTDPVPVPVE